MHKSKVIVLDFGSQVSRLIVKAIRRIGVYAELVPFNADIDLLDKTRGEINHPERWTLKRG